MGASSVHRFASGLLLVSLAISSHAATQCQGPSTIQAEIRAHPQADAFVRLGEWFQARQKEECAAEAFRSALHLKPNSVHISELLGGSLIDIGDLNAAAEVLKQSIQISPSAPGTRVGLAQALEQLHQGDEAKVQWQAALKLDPKSVTALDGLSKHLIAEANYGGAIELLRSAAVDVTRHEKLALDLAQAYAKSGMVDDAGALLKKALAVHPSSFPLTFALTTVLMSKVYFREAAEVSGNFALKRPDDVDAQRLYLQVLVTAQEAVRAAPLARKLLASHPQDPYFLYANGVMELQAGNYSIAKQHLEQSIAMNPSNGIAHLNLGLVLAKLNDNIGAKQQFEQVLALQNPPLEVHFELAKVLKVLGDTEGAERQLKTYQELTEVRAARSLAKAKSDEAEQALASGNSRRAIELYREALQARPEDASLNYKLSVALDAAGDTSAERNALEKAIQIDPDLALAHNQLGYLDSRDGDYSAAEEHFRQAVRAAPEYVAAWINLAATFGMQSKFAEADAVIATALKLNPDNKDALQLHKELASAPGRK